MSTDWRAAYTEMLASCPNLGETVGVAIGAGSMCWENPAGAGEFDSTRASLLVDALVERIQAQVKARSELRVKVADLPEVKAAMEQATQRIADHRAELDRWRKVIVEYVNQVESGEKFGALVDLVYDESGELQ